MIPCIQEENIGKIKEFMENSKGVRGTLTMIAFAIVLQVCSFLYLWGSLVSTVNTHDKNIEKICNKLDKIQIIGYAIAEEK